MLPMAPLLEDVMFAGFEQTRYLCEVSPGGAWDCRRRERGVFYSRGACVWMVVLGAYVNAALIVSPLKETSCSLNSSSLDR